MLLLASQFGTDKIECSFEIGKLTHTKVPFILLLILLICPHYSLLSSAETSLKIPTGLWKICKNIVDFMEKKLQWDSAELLW